jgi:glycosyltransferase involved in cell wall biosynthesis
MKRTLYICYFGIREPLVQTQVLPYLREIGKGDFTAETRRRGEDEIKISLLTFEPSRDESDIAEFAVVKERLAAEGIEWEWLPYHKRPSAIATLWDIVRGTFYIWRRIGRFDILHGRVHVPTLMAALARKFSRHRPKLLFDIRGFFPEEYTDAGVWPENGLLYRSAKRVERWLMKEADGFVVLTEKARNILFGERSTTPSAEAAATPPNQGGEFRPVEVIPCCVDFEKRFSGERESLRLSVRKQLNIENRLVIVHVGALGGLYLTKEIADLLAAARDRDDTTFALFLSQTDRKVIEPLLIERGFGPDDYFIGRVPPVEIEGYLYASDVGLSIVKASYATQSRSPTKIPEYLACGLPIIANAGVGDVDSLIEENGVGALLKDFDTASYTSALVEIENLGDIGDACRRVAVDKFDLETVGGMKYRRLYSQLLG